MAACEGQEHWSGLANAKALEMLCDAYAKWREARRVVEGRGMGYECDTK